MVPTYHYIVPPNASGKKKKKNPPNARNRGNT